MKHFIPILFTFLVPTALVAQKKPIDHSVYDDWKSLSNISFSPSGKLIFYKINPQQGDSQLELRNSKKTLLFRADRANNFVLTEGEDYLVSSISPHYSETREARIKKKKLEEMPKDSLLVYAINSKRSINYGPIKSFKTAEKAQRFVAFVQELSPKKTKEADTKNEVDSSKTMVQKKAAVKKQAVLVLADLATNDTLQYWNVDQYSFSNNEKYLIYNIKHEEKDSLLQDVLNIVDLRTKKSRTISTGKATYKSFTFDHNEKNLVFLADKTPSKSLLKDFKVYHYDFAKDSAEVIIDRSTPSVPEKWYVSGDANLRYDYQNQRIVLGLAPIPLVKDTTLVEFEHAKVDIWHWQDEVLMTQQLVNLKRDQSKNYEAIYTFETKKLLPLIDDTYDRIVFADSIRTDWAVATSAQGNKIEAQWQGYTLQKVYTVSLTDGAKDLILDNFVGQSYISPEGKYLVIYNSKDENWSAYNFEKRKWIDLTKGLGIQFSDEENDMPIFAGSYGLAGWTKGDKAVYINDRYDIWNFDLEKGTKTNLTNGYGRKNNIRFRFVIPEQYGARRKKGEVFEEGQKYLFSTFNYIDKTKGFSELNGKKSKNPQSIVQDRFTYNNIATDKKGDVYIYTKENYQQSPDLYYSADFKKELRLTDINPQQADYNWGTAELVRWTTPQGHQAEGILYKPENFDPNKKYPIIAYFYETLSEGLFSYQAPAPTPSRLNIPYYVSNEYLVFAPDIRYETGHPGRSAEEYVNSGMRFLSKENWVDSTKMAIQGQSWGGYQVAHLITRTNMYAAAWTGAPVVNMTSAYGGIRWQSGMSRQFQYEHTQSRIGQNLWENKELYIENSPLFFLDKVTTPVAIMSNDNDGAVPWYQGIEMFTALRRLGKPSWLLNYNGDEHNLMQRQNRKDIQVRQAQFFDHFLKGKEAPEWILKGVPAINKGISWGF